MQSITPRFANDSGFEFIQRCQVVIGAAGADFVSRADAIWTCLSHFPRGVTGAEQRAACLAVYRLAIDFYAYADAASVTNPSVYVRREHANELLLLVSLRFRRQHLTMRELAQSVGVSSAYLSRSLSAQTAYTFRTHLNGTRLLSAVLLLSNRLLPIYVIAEDVGYLTTGELDRQFKRWLGTSPRRFKQLLTDSSTRRVLTTWGREADRGAA